MAERKIQQNTTLRPTFHAVIIGINTYKDPGIRDLSYADKDAQAMYDVLVDPELGRFKPDNVTLLLNEKATEREIKIALKSDLPRRVSSDDTVIIFYAGHGAPAIDTRVDASEGDDGFEKYIVPYNAELKHMNATAISMEDVQEWFGRLSARRVLFFVDACYSGAAGGRTFQLPGIKTRSIKSEKFLKNLGTAGRIIITACGISEVALEHSDEQQGLFTYYLVKGLKGAADDDDDGFVSVDELYKYVHRNVENHAKRLNGKMKPTRHGSVSGQVYITQYKSQPVVSTVEGTTAPHASPAIPLAGTSFSVLQRMIGTTSMAFPIILALGLPLIYQKGIQPSLSHYHHTELTLVFAGFLIGIGAFFFFYFRARENIQERITSAVAGGSLFAIALFPISIDGSADSNLFHQINDVVHLMGLALFFLTQVSFMLFFFPEKPDGGPFPVYKKRRNRLFRASGWVLIAYLVVQAGFSLMMPQAASAYNLYFWLDGLSILTFGFAWFVKGNGLPYFNEEKSVALA